ncbi:MAG: 16S rRNA (cytosine(1407)-C(5))-methyltransferase RsmF, partial [candidate division WOR-3 bacterium]|nr:16S rRNA (cytosine(1407)-C(5))-methyltransferase RsmF [candidate division WOR-3 bacterium]
MTRGLNFPKEFLSRYQKIIPEFDKFVEILKVPLIPSLRINTLKAPKEKILAELSSLDLEPIPWCNDGYYVKNQLNLGSLEIHKQGLIYLQEATSML